MRFLYVPLIIFFNTFTILAADLIEIPESQSPNGRYAFRMIDNQPNECEVVGNLQLIDHETKAVLVSISINGYARFPYNTDKENLKISWSPTSTYVAITTRDTKRTWGSKIYRLENGKLTEVKIPNLTNYVFELLKAKKCFRYIRQTPERWINDNTLLVQLQGDAITPNQVSPVIKYDTKVIISIPSGEIREFTPLSIKPEEG